MAIPDMPYGWKSHLLSCPADLRRSLCHPLMRAGLVDTAVRNVLVFLLPLSAIISLLVGAWITAMVWKSGIPIVSHFGTGGTLLSVSFSSVASRCALWLMEYC